MYTNRKPPSTLMPYPIVNPRAKSTSNNVDRVSNAMVSASNTPGNSAAEPKSKERTRRLRLCGTSLNEKMFIFTGNIDKVLRWYRIVGDTTCLFEVFGSVICIQQGTIQSQQIMLLRNTTGKGPVLRVMHYSTTRLEIEDFHLGMRLRCVGKMIAPSTLTAFTIRNATDASLQTLQRMACICDHAISQFLDN